MKLYKICMPVWFFVYTHTELIQVTQMTKSHKKHMFTTVGLNKVRSILIQTRVLFDFDSVWVNQVWNGTNLFHADISFTHSLFYIFIIKIKPIKFTGPSTRNSPTIRGPWSSFEAKLLFKKYNINREIKNLQLSNNHWFFFFNDLWLKNSTSTFQRSPAMIVAGYHRMIPSSLSDNDIDYPQGNFENNQAYNPPH